MKVALAGAAGCALALVAVLLAAYAVGPIERLDADAIAGFAALRTPHRLDVAEFLAHLADPAALFLMLLALAAAGLALGRRREVLVAALAVAAANVTTQALKALLAHPRIQATGADIGPVAFPSGHATAAMSIAVAAALVAPRRARPLVGAAGVAFALCVSLAIMVLGWHFPSDVVGGILIATGAGFVALAGLRAWEHWRPAPEADGDTEPAPGHAERPRIGLEAALAATAAAALVLGVAWAQDLLDYARLHTAAVVAASTLGLASAMLMASLIAVASR